jgi:hypothetical protein
VDPINDFPLADAAFAPLKENFDEFERLFFVPGAHVPREHGAQGVRSAFCGSDTIESRPANLGSAKEPPFDPENAVRKHFHEALYASLKPVRRQAI